MLDNQSGEVKSVWKWRSDGLVVEHP